MEAIDPGLGLGAPLKDSHRLCDFLMEVPFASIKVPFTRDQWPFPFNNEIKGLAHLNTLNCFSAVNATGMRN